MANSAIFFQHAIADGIHHLLFALRPGPHLAQLPRSKGQLVFDFLKPLFLTAMRKLLVEAA